MPCLRPHLLIFLVSLLSPFARGQGLCDVVLGQMAEVSRPPTEHPDLLRFDDFPSLKAGDKIVVEPSVFGWKSKIANRLRGPIEVTVKKVKKLKPGQWGDKGTILYVSHPAFGTTGLRDWRVHGHAYRTPDYALHSPFLPNDLVQIGSEIFNFRDMKLKVAEAPENSLTIPSSVMPYFGRYVGIHDVDH